MLVSMLPLFQNQESIDEVVGPSINIQGRHTLPHFALKWQSK